MASDRDTLTEGIEEPAAGRSDRRRELSPLFCGYGSCDRPPGHDGQHLCRCSKPVDVPRDCVWHTPGMQPTVASDRDTLAELIDQHPTIPSRYAPQIADRVIAAGWRPPARVVADGGEVEAIAVEWMRYIGYTAEQIAEAEGQSCADTCERVGDAWDCTDQDGDSLHPVADELAAAVAMANVAMETIEARGWRPPAREITTAEELDALPEWSAVLDRDPKGRKAWVKLGPYWYLPAYRPHYTASQILCFGAAVTVLHVPTEEASRPNGATLQCGQCGVVAHAPASPDGRTVPIHPLAGWTVIPDKHVVRCPSCPTEKAGGHG